MSTQFKTNVKSKDIKLVEKDTVQISSTGLLNTFAYSTKDALGKLKSEIGPVKITSITIDDKGRILVKDAGFRSLVEAKLSAQTKAADTNYVCNNAYQCKIK